MILLLVAAASVWFAFQRPDYFVRMISFAVVSAGASLWAFLGPRLLKPASPEELARRKALRDRGEEDAPAARPFNRQKEK